MDIYNLLPEEVIQAGDVHTFQAKLQNILKDAAWKGRGNWEMMFSPRLPLHLHPLRELITECRDVTDTGVVTNVQVGLAPIATNNNACMASWLKFRNGDLNN